jgi:hypothetical protein
MLTLPPSTVRPSPADPERFGLGEVSAGARSRPAGQRASPAAWGAEPASGVVSRYLIS